jgi:hypothetical protein
MLIACTRCRTEHWQTISQGDGGVYRVADSVLVTVSSIPRSVSIHLIGSTGNVPGMLLTVTSTVAEIPPWLRSL